MINFLVEIDVKIPISNFDTNGVTDTIRFLSNPLDPENPSNNILFFPTNVQTHNIPVRLKAPSFNRKLSDNVNGIFLNQGFSLSFINNDGFFDRDGKNFEGFPNINYFGGEVRLYKTNKTNPKYLYGDDFSLIAKGKIINTKTTFNEFIIDIADNMKSMDNAFSKPISEFNFNFNFQTQIPNADFFGGGMVDGTLKQTAPYIYGTALAEVKPLAKMALLTGFLDAFIQFPFHYAFDIFYLAANVQEVIAFYNSKGEKLPFVRHDENYVYRGARIKILDARQNMCIIYRRYDETLDDDLIPHSVLLRGGSSNMGEIIKEILSVKQGINYNEGNFNLQEYNFFINNTNDISIILDSGSIKQVIDNILKNDNAFFIQQPDGRFTVRKYNFEYNQKNINGKPITKINEKSYNNFDENYANEVIIRYALQVNPNLPRLTETRTGFLNVINSVSKNIYKKENTRTFETQIINEGNARAFGQNIINRFSSAKLTVSVGIGDDVSDYNLLDTVNLNLSDINGRNFCSVNKWKIKEINYAQDVLILEEAE